MALNRRLHALFVGCVVFGMVVCAEPAANAAQARPAKKAKLGAVTENHTDLDAYGRVDTSGKQVPFYPSMRGSHASSKNQSSAYRKGQRPKAPPK